MSDENPSSADRSAPEEPEEPEVEVHEDRGAHASGVPAVAELFRLEPCLTELEREVDGVRDDGSAGWFCSNFLWLPVNTRLRLLVGVARLPQPGDAEHPELYDSHSYEKVFEHLSRRLPPCRACGCRRFLALREADD